MKTTLLLLIIAPTHSFFERTLGCAGYRCDAAASSSTALQLPSLGIPAFASFLNRSAGLEAVVSPGCIAQTSNLVCAFPVIGDASTWSGYVRVDSTGVQHGIYTNVGSSHCRADASGSTPSNLPAMDIYGDLVLLDTTGVALVQGITTAWGKRLEPAAMCPDLMASVVVSESGRLMMFLGSLGEIFGYYENGVPVGSLQLWANVSSPPGPPPTGWSPHDGVLVPISQQALGAGGARTVLLTRFYLTDDASPRPTLTPTGDLRLSATDLQDTKVPRIARPWMLQLVLPPDVSACIPEASGTVAGTERLAVAGPITFASGMAVLALSCPGVSTHLNVYGFNVDTAESSRIGTAPVPSTAWTIHIPLANNGTASPRWLAADASTSPDVTTVLWLADGESLYAIDSVAGIILGNASLQYMTTVSPSKPCSTLSRSVLHVEGPLLTAAGGSNGTTAIVAPISAVAVDNSTTHWVLSLELDTQGRGAVTWCAPTPGTVPGMHPVEGQLAVMTGLSDGSVLGMVTREGVFGLQ